MITMSKSFKRWLRNYIVHEISDDEFIELKNRINAQENIQMKTRNELYDCLKNKDEVSKLLLSTQEFQKKLHEEEISKALNDLAELYINSQIKPDDKKILMEKVEELRKLTALSTLECEACTNSYRKSVPSII